MFINNFDPVAFQIFSLEIRWYSLSYISGILLGWFYCKKYIINNQLILKLFDDFITYLIIGIILGGRLGYVIFYDLIYFIKNPVEILMIWNGGMSFHGGLVGVIISVFLFSKKHKIDKYIFLDLISLSAPIGIFFGRLANFVNSELFGKETDVLWSVKFLAVDNVSRHPSQIYEAILEGIILFIVLNYIFKKKIFAKPGIISALFLILYSLFRFLAEFFRVPDMQIGYLVFNLSMGQIVSIVFFSIGIYLFFKKKNES